MPILTKYEKARIIGNRAAQICSNSVIYLFLDSSELKSMTPLEIAEMELEKKVIPFTIRRFMPNGTFEEWNVSELDC
jgi:DNA-directed RNA polymerases I, II, and III subunit RPABC2